MKSVQPIVQLIPTVNLDGEKHSFISEYPLTNSEATDLVAVNYGGHN